MPRLWADASEMMFDAAISIEPPNTADKIAAPLVIDVTGTSSPAFLKRSSRSA